MLFKLDDSLLPFGPPHDALGQNNSFRPTVMNILVSIFMGTLIGCARLANALIRFVKLSAAALSRILGREGYGGEAGGA